MKKWSKLMGNIYVYDPSVDSMNFGINISENISPLTELFLDTFVNSCNDNNIIISCPEIMLRTVPLISYSYSHLFDKSVLIFTSNSKGLANKSIKDIHNFNYCLLNNNGAYVFYEAMIGYLSNKKLESKIQLPLAKRKYRKKIIKNLENRFLMSNDPKVLLFSGNDMSIIDSINELWLDSNKCVSKNTDIDIDIGYIIFENVDYFINSEYTARKFIEWIRPYSLKGIKFLFHFSNPHSKFIDMLNLEIDSHVLLFNKSFLENNEYIYEKSMNYFRSDKPNSFIRNFNLDSDNFYSCSKNIKVLDPPLKCGNLDYHFYEADKLQKSVDVSKLKHKHIFYRSTNILRYFRDLIINPSKFKFSFEAFPGEWKSFYIVDFLNWFRKSIKNETSENKLILDQYISRLFNIYFELSNCKRFGEPHSFSRINKNYKLLDIISKLNGSENYVIASYLRNEASILNEELASLGLNDNVVVKYIGWLNESSWDRSEYILLLPGPIPNKFRSELLQPYKEIQILVYEGFNSRMVQNQLDEVINNSKIDEIKSISYLKDIDDDLNIIPEQFFENYDEIPSLDDIHNNFGDNAENPEDLKNSEDDEFKEIVKHIQVEKRAIDQESIISGKNFYLRNLTNGESSRKRLSSNKTYFYLNRDKNSFEEGVIDEFKKGDLIILLDNDIKKSLLDLASEVFGFNNSVNKDIIYYWKSKLLFFIIKNSLSLKEFHKLYTKAGGDKSLQSTSLWARGKVLGPLDSEDLYLIGKVTGDEILINNHKMISEEISKVRNLHRVTGRKLNKLIKKIIHGDIDIGNLSFDEHIFYERIKDGIYEIIDID